MLGVRVADAYLGCVGLIAAELFAVAFLERRELSGAWEVAIALRLLPLAWVAVAPVAILLGGLVEACSAIARRVGRGGVTRAMVPRTAVFLGTAALALVLDIGAAAANSNGVLIGAFALIAASSASCARRPRPGAATTGIASVVFFAFSAALAAKTYDRLGTAGNVRDVYRAHGPLLGRVAELAEHFVLLPPSTPTELASRVGTALDVRESDILLVTLETERADHVGAFGADPSPTPNFDRLAGQGVVFDAAYAPTPNTPYAIASVLTGKPMAALATEGFGGDSETLADQFARYGRVTASFTARDVSMPADLGHLDARGYGFGTHVSFDDDPKRTLDDWLVRIDRNARVFAWVHLGSGGFDEPSHASSKAYDIGLRQEDEALGRVVEDFVARRPGAMVVVLGMRGQAFDEHGVRDREPSVYEEDVRVPALIAGGGLTARRIRSPISLLDVAPTILRADRVPLGSRLQGHERITAILGGDEDGFAFAETRTMTLVASGPFRFVCARRSGVCTLFNVDRDPGETRDVTSNHPDVVARLRSALESQRTAIDRYEVRDAGPDDGLWPEPLRRGIAGDATVAPLVAKLLDDPDIAVRRKAAAVLVDLRRFETVADLRRALGGDADETVRDFAAIALTRLGESSPRTVELLANRDQNIRRLAALALAEQGDDHGLNELVVWWRSAFPHDPGEASVAIDPDRAKELLVAFSKIRPRPMILPLIDSLRSARLRPFIATTLADIGDDAARVPLADALLAERVPSTRSALLDALLRLKAGAEIVKALIAQLGASEPIPRGLEAALRTKMLQHVGGPADTSENLRMKRFASTGVAVDFFVPDVAAASQVRAICLATSNGAGEIRIGRRLGYPSSNERKSPIPTEAPPLDPARSLTMKVGASQEPFQVFATIPASVDVRIGKPASLVVFATENVSLEACALVPLRASDGDDHSH